MSDHLYRIIYTTEPRPEGVRREDIPDGAGASDALLLASIIYPGDGGLDVAIASRDGRTNAELSDAEVFKVWSILALQLSESKTLDPGRREFARLTFESIRAAVLHGRAKGEAH